MCNLRAPAGTFLHYRKVPAGAEWRFLRGMCDSEDMKQLIKCVPWVTDYFVELADWFWFFLLPKSELAPCPSNSALLWLTFDPEAGRLAHMKTAKPQVLFLKVPKAPAGPPGQRRSNERHKVTLTTDRCLICFDRINMFVFILNLTEWNCKRTHNVWVSTSRIQQQICRSEWLSFIGKESIWQKEAHVKAKTH